MKLSKAERETVRMKFGGKCAYCGCDLPEKGWHADHVFAVDRRNGKWVKNESTGFSVYVEIAHLKHPENDRSDNLFPACRACNIDKQNMAPEDWRKVLEGRVGVCRRNYSAFRHAERFGLVQEINKSVVFWFEQYAGENNQ